MVVVFDEGGDDPCTMVGSFDVHGGLAIGFVGWVSGPFGLLRV